MAFENYIERLSDTVSFPMIAVKGGSFLMGEGKDHRVTVADFYIGQFLVTQEVWMEIMGENPSYFRGKDRPVEDISWNDVINKFLPRLNERTNKEYRLPSESEWEYAARGGERSKGFLYSGGNKLKEVGWYRKNSHKETKGVGQKLPNELGIYDMSGNVREWCSDPWDQRYEGAPVDGIALVGGNSARRVVRGGSWVDIDVNGRVSVRSRNLAYNRYFFIGIRVSRS